jgi:3-methyl-2-oxobutanoate hydroxymethyltransferase
MLSLYDAPSAAIACDAGADCLLVGDSLSNVVLGYDDYLSVTTDDIAHHLGAVVRGTRKSSRPQFRLSRICLLPPVLLSRCGSQQRTADANGCARRQAGGRGAKRRCLRFEYSQKWARRSWDILGFTPQSALVLRGVVQGKTVEAAQRLLTMRTNSRTPVASRLCWKLCRAK